MVQPCNCVLGLMAFRCAPDEQLCPQLIPQENFNLCYAPHALLFVLVVILYRKLGPLLFLARMHILFQQT